MTLALLLVLVERDLPTANALKNMTNGAITLPAGILLAFLGPVHWAAAARWRPERWSARASARRSHGPCPRRDALGGGSPGPGPGRLAVGEAQRLALTEPRQGEPRQQCEAERQQRQMQQGQADRRPAAGEGVGDRLQ